MGNKKNFIDRHHCVPSSRKGTNDGNNIIRINRKYHEALHIVFENDTPVEQICRILDINDKCLTQKFKTKILKALEEEEPYKPGVIS